MEAVKCIPKKQIAYQLRECKNYLYPELNQQQKHQRCYSQRSGKDTDFWSNPEFPLYITKIEIKQSKLSRIQYNEYNKKSIGNTATMSNSGYTAKKGCSFTWKGI